MNQMRLWMQSATTKEQRQLADMAETTVGTLHQISGSYRTHGEPSVRSGLAGKIQTASVALNKTNKNLPLILRTDLAPECRECEYAHRCLKSAVVVSEFQMVEDLI